MNKKNIILGTAITFVALAICSFFVNISTQIITTLSIASLSFTISQAIHNILSNLDDEIIEKFNAFKNVYNFEIDEKWMMIYKKYLIPFSHGKKEKILKVIANIFECLSVIVLILGICIPIDCFKNETVSTFCTILSLGILFFNIWLVGIIKNRIKEWNNIQILNILLKGQNKMSEDDKFENNSLN